MNPLYIMISASQSKLIRSLRQKKYRDQLKLYLAEGEKIIGELAVSSAPHAHAIRQIFATGDWIHKNRELLHRSQLGAEEATPDELKKVSNLVTPQPVIAVVSMPERPVNPEELADNPVLAFEAIRDPGNLGTIIRTADWFGIKHLICTPDSADLYNPKVVQATMGAITRVALFYLPIEEILSAPELRDKVVYGTFLEGESVYGAALDKNPLILFGNESRGLSDRYDRFIRKKIAIPSFSADGIGSESLNLAASVAVICSEMRRG